MPKGQDKGFGKVSLANPLRNGGCRRMHLRYATVKAPFGRLCFPESPRKPSLGPTSDEHGRDAR